MDGGFPGRLTGSEIHGFKTMEDLDVRNMMEEAKSRWLRPNEIHAILCNHTYFSILVKPVNLPQSGTIVLFDRKMLRNFRKDGHNWKKKKDGKTVKEAHEHLKVGDEERIHVYYAHGQDNPNFVRRCYWLLDKKQEHIVLVHYRETLELQGSPVTPVNSNSSSTSDPSASRVLSEETDSGADHAFYAGSVSSLVGESTDLGDSMTVRNHEMRLHEINTLEWEDLLATQHPSDPTAAKGDELSYFEQQNLYGISDSKSNELSPLLLSSQNQLNGICSPGLQGSLLPANNIAASSGSIDAKLPTNDYFRTVGKDESLGIFAKDGMPKQDSFGRWMNYIVIDSPGSVDDPPLEASISIGYESNLPDVMDHHQPIQEQVFSITEVSPAWAFSTEETKVVVIGLFHGEYSQLADSNLFFVLGNVCVPAEMVQLGVFRCMALPQNPGFVNLYLSLDGRRPISQVLTFEYRSPSMNILVASPEDVKCEEFQDQLRLAHLLYSTPSILNLLSSKVSSNALKVAKNIASNFSVEKDWAHLIESIGNKEISFPQAKNSLFELTLKNKFVEWILERVAEGCKTTARDKQGQGVIHLCAILGYTWAVKPFSHSGLSLDFRDASGWTALHWAAYRGREDMVAALLSAGAKANLVTDPTPEFPGGLTAADLASKNGYDGLGAYLAEMGLIKQVEDMYISGNLSEPPQTSSNNLVNPVNLNEDELCLKDTLAAYRAAADAASCIQSAFRERSLKIRSKEVQFANPEIEARNIIAAMKIQHAFRNYETRKRMTAAARIQHRFRTWKIRKDFLNMRRQTIKIQAVFRGFQVRRQYRKILWSVGVLEKAVLRWRQKRKGFRGLQVEPTQPVVNQTQESEAEEDFFCVSRKQAEERVERSVTRVQAMFRSKQAQQEYRRMKLAHSQAALEYKGLLDPAVRNWK